MKLKGFLMFLSLLLVFTSFAFNTGSAEASKNSKNSNMLSQQTIDLVDKFVVIEDGQFVIKNAEVLSKKINKKEFAKVNEEINNRNAVLSEITEEELKDMYVSGNSIEFSNENGEEPTFSLMASQGKNAIEVYWWGYKLYLNDNLTNTTAQALAAGAGGAAIAALWVPVFSPPSIVAKAIAGTLVIVFGGSSAMFYKTNKGNGVYLRFTGVVPYVAYTGMFAQ